MKSKMLFSAIAGLALAGCSVCDCARCSKDPVVGDWGLKLPYDTMSAGTMTVTRGEDGAPKAFVLWRWASPVWMKDVKVEGNSFSFTHPWGHKVSGTVEGDTLKATVVGKNGENIGEVSGWRNPPVPVASTKDAKFGEPIDLLAGGLDGWVLMDPKAKNGWKFENGVLSNCLGLNEKGKWAGGGSNLMTKRNDFFDFNLSYDVRVPKASNSGVYLRGRYEIQVVDSYGKPVDCHNMAAYYGRVAPSAAVEKAPGEWQHVDVTLYKRHLTVVLNGTTILDDVPVTGVTGGAIDADETVPGPLYLQGDHSDADFKNMILRKAVD